MIIYKIRENENKNRVERRFNVKSNLMGQDNF
jgi:hypothetical protein